LVLSFALAAPAADYSAWKHSGSLFILTTRDGAALPASASVEGFPLLVRLHKDFFNFSQAKPDGGDLRFSSAGGEPLPYQIEEWDPSHGVATIFVRIPKIQGDARQELKLHWGNPDAASESDGKAVFNASNGYLSVWHMSDPVQDEVATLKTVDAGTTSTPGVVGKARHFPGGKGLFGGDRITTYPSGSNSHTTEAWFRTGKPNTPIVAWGNEEAQGKVVMRYASPPQVRMDCYFSGANVATHAPLKPNQWTHVVHTYQKGDSRIYINGVLEGESKTDSAPLAIHSPSKLWIGGWYDNYDFVGDLDEVRISKVARSPEWIRLQYENQKPFQTLVGPVVQPGAEFSFSQADVVVPEGKSVKLTAKAGAAQKVYWVVKRDGVESLAASPSPSTPVASSAISLSPSSSRPSTRTGSRRSTSPSRSARTFRNRSSPFQPPPPGTAEKRSRSSLR
jgi:hypothetical protein